MVPKTKLKCPNFIKRKVIINKRTGQASITLPKKVYLKKFGKLPKSVKLKLK